MPEGDTVWRTARTLDRALRGLTLTRTDFRVPGLATTDLAGEAVEQTRARGKHLLTRIGTAYTLHTHLKMEGSWHLYAAGLRWRRPVHEARVVLHTEHRVAVGFALGIVELLPREAEADAVAHLGPDLLGPDWDLDEAVRRLLADPGRPVGEALLDQRTVAGIGNIYRNELCFLAGLPPGAPVAAVADPARLLRQGQAMLLANRERAEQSTTGDLRPGRRTWVYRQRSCRRCGTPVTVGSDAGGRATYRCPACQPSRQPSRPPS